MTNHTQRLIAIEEQVKKCRINLPILISEYNGGTRAIPEHMLEKLATSSYELEVAIVNIMKMLLPENDRKK